MATPEEVPQLLRELIATHAKSIMDMGPETAFLPEHALRLAAGAKLGPAG
jgi:hypothetical protein